MFDSPLSCSLCFSSVLSLQVEINGFLNTVVKLITYPYLNVSIFLLYQLFCSIRYCLKFGKLKTANITSCYEFEIIEYLRKKDTNEPTPGPILSIREISSVSGRCFANYSINILPSKDFARS